MANKKIGAYITLDGEKEFRAATSACNKSVSTLRSEMKLAEAQTAGSANTLDALKRKHDILSRTLDAQIKKEEAVKSGLKHAEEQYQKVGNELEGYKEKLELAKESLEKMKKTSETTEKALNEQAEQVETLEKVVEKGEKTYQQAGNRVQNWKKQLNNAEAQTIRTTKALNENKTYLEEAENSYKKCAKSIDEFGNKTDNAAGKLTKFGTIAKANLKNTAVEIGKDAFSNAVKGTLELQDAQNQLQASTGQTKEEMKEYNAEMQSMYKAGYSESITDAANAMALVQQYTNETNPAKIRELAENTMVLRETFGMDLSESIRGADALIRTMGVDGKTAFDLMAAGAQNGLNKSGELGDNLAEYAPLWAQAGFSAEEMFAILENGLDSGAYNLDKVNDYVKEFGNSLADGRVEKNLGSFSEGTQDLFLQWKNGQATTKQVFQSVISDLATMENQQQALAIASDTWSALGEDNSMKVITSLNDVNNKYKDVHGTMEEIKKVKYDSVSNQWKVLGRTAQTEIITPILEDFLPVANSGLKLISGNIKGITTLAKVAAPAVAGIFVVKKGNDLVELLEKVNKRIKAGTVSVAANTVAKKAETAAETESVAAKTAGAAATTAGTTATTGYATITGIATAAQNVFNSAVAASPIGVMLVGIVAVTGAIAVFSDKIETATSNTDALSEATDENIKKIEKASESLKKSTEGWKESLSEVKAQEGVADNLVTELYELEGQTGKTEAEIGKMNAIAGQLNSMFPELSLSVDENTGALNKNEKQTRQSVEAAIQLAKASAAQEKMADIADKLVEADMAKYEAEQNLDKIGDELLALDKERKRITEESSEAVKQGAESYTEYNGKMVDTQSALMQIAEAEETLKEKKEEQEEALDGLVEKYNEANEKYQNAYEYTQDLTNGTQSNTKAIEENTGAKQANQEADIAKQEISAASIETVGREMEAYKNLSVTQQQLAVDVTNGVLTMQENVQSALESQMNMFEEFDGGIEISTEQLLANMQSQVDGVTAWEQNLSTLADRGINQGILQKLAEMGPQGSGYVAAFNAMTDEELAKAGDLWSQSVDIQGMTNEWGQQLLTSGAANIAGGMQGLNTIMQESGANTVAGLVQGMQNAQEVAKAAGQDLGVKTIESVNNGLGTHSPSIKTTQSGKDTAQGLTNGLNAGKQGTTVAARSVANGVIVQFNSTLGGKKLYNHGLNASNGLAEGIRDGKSEVIQAAIEVAGAAIKAAKDKLEIHSPSHVFRDMGHNTMESYELGVKDRRKSVQKSVMESLDFEEIGGKVNMRSGMSAAEEQRGMQNAVLAAMSKVKLIAYIGERQITRSMSDLGVVFNAEI